MLLSGVFPSQGELTTVRTIEMALVDYIHLYFPETIRPHGEERMNSLLEFAMVMEEAPDSETKQNLHTNHYRCLACQWMMPSCQSTSSLKYHIKGSSDVQHCPSVTIYMQIEGINEAIQDMETSASYSSRNPRRGSYKLLICPSQWILLLLSQF